MSPHDFCTIPTYFINYTHHKTLYMHISLTHQSHINMALSTVPASLNPRPPPIQFLITYGMQKTLHDILFGWILRLPALHSFAFLQNTYLWFAIYHIAANFCEVEISRFSRSNTSSQKFFPWKFFPPKISCRWWVKEAEHILAKKIDPFYHRNIAPSTSGQVLWWNWHAHWDQKQGINFVWPNLQLKKKFWNRLENISTSVYLQEGKWWWKSHWGF